MGIRHIGARVSERAPPQKVNTDYADHSSTSVNLRETISQPIFSTMRTVLQRIAERWAVRKIPTCYLDIFSILNLTSAFSISVVKIRCPSEGESMDATVKVRSTITLTVDGPPLLVFASSVLPM